MNPVDYQKTMQYLSNVLNGVIEEEDDQIKQKCDDKVILWMKMSYLNKDLDMRHKSTKKDLICILIDIILYQDSKMVNSAFTILCKYFQQQLSVYEYASQVQLLQDQQEVAILKKVGSHVKDMKRSSEGAEFWMGKDDPASLKKARNFIDKLNFLTDLCIHRPNRVIEIEDDKKKKNQEDEGQENEEQDEEEFEFLNLSELKQEWDEEDTKVCTDEEKNDPKFQLLLYNLSAHQAPILITKSAFFETAENPNCYLRVLEKSYIFLIKFVRNNKEN